jgi:hypothetical protein
MGPQPHVFDITGSFADLEKASVVVSVVVDGVTEFTSSSFTGSSDHQGAIPFVLHDVKLTPGKTVDFVVDSLGQQGDDAVGLTAQISNDSFSVPGPIAGAGLPGLLAGFGAILAWYRKRRAVAA